MDPDSSHAIAVLDCQDAEANNTLIGLRLEKNYWIENTFEVSSSDRQVQVPISEAKKYSLREIYINPRGFTYELPQIEYQKILVDINGVKNLSVSSISKGLEHGRDKMLVLWTPMGEIEYPIVALVFINRREMHGYGCMVLIKRQDFRRFTVEATVVEVQPEIISQFGPSFNESAIKRVVNHVRSLDISSDRIRWQHPRGKWWLRVEIKKKIMDGDKVFHLNIEEELDNGH